ncbi:hypothetical protein [Glutamicibacter sp. FBE19]|uniref:hypothetical protein n=1 Tax=Glutamicibacter sp. FBE19 TaxID=2761534 RepID=UPI00189657E1|nr:hypothetical protein [Glutamicibacter sp. FBE19]MBF6671570.1 hypothetical protein [Glutamicibacter sp. FBE19]
MTSTPLNPDSQVSKDQTIFAYKAAERDFPQHGSIMIKLHHNNFQSSLLQISKKTAESLRDQLNDLLAVPADTIATSKPNQNLELVNSVESFINQRPEYITALKNTRGTDDQTDYHRWQGGAEARRQLAETLGWTVPHNPGETTRPEVEDA